MFSDQVNIKFTKDDDVKNITGQWCLPCKWVPVPYNNFSRITYMLTRGDKNFVKWKGIHKAFHIRGNSSCCQHLHQHYKLYQTQCKEVDIPENHWAVPRSIWKVRQKAANDKNKVKELTQGKLSEMFGKVDQTWEFTCKGVLHAVAQFIACNDQVCSD